MSFGPWPWYIPSPIANGPVDVTGKALDANGDLICVSPSPSSAADGMMMMADGGSAVVSAPMRAYDTMAVDSTDPRLVWVLGVPHHFTDADLSDIFAGKGHIRSAGGYLKTFYRHYRSSDRNFAQS